MFIVKSKNRNVLRFLVKEDGEYVQAVINNKEEVMTEELTSQIIGLRNRGLVTVSNSDTPQKPKTKKRKYTPKPKPQKEEEVKEIRFEEEFKAEEILEDEDLGIDSNEDSKISEDE